MTDRTVSVHTNRLTRRFGTFTAVNEVSLDVFQGEIFGFLGANGAGKTTMIRMLCGLLLPSEGSGRVAGYDIFRNSDEIKRRIGYMSQKFSLYDDLTIAENIELYGGLYQLSRQQIRQRRQELIEQVGLGNLRGKLTRDVPLGFKQRMALGCALLHDPPIVFLDEPSSGVDPEARRSFWDLIYQTAATGKTVFVTTHFMDEAEYCHRIAIMRDGSLIALDTPGNLKETYQKSTIQDVFLEVARDRPGLT